MDQEKTQLGNPVAGGLTKTRRNLNSGFRSSVSPPTKFPPFSKQLVDVVPDSSELNDGVPSRRFSLELSKSTQEDNSLCPPPSGAGKNTSKYSIKIFDPTPYRFRRLLRRLPRPPPLRLPPLRPKRDPRPTVRLPRNRGPTSPPRRAQRRRLARVFLERGRRRRSSGYHHLRSPPPLHRQSKPTPIHDLSILPPLRPRSREVDLTRQALVG
ncbi:hypothetical protein Vadar_025544 [Vaccinium darrowii]|uniref:Uncharacterized protein n=1 Tax=Vaccinium darrowii TaxID=229202 RepID=A0ACB7Y391_9ERIC|nr:hypothetical protein Vadar_025544 [Vaccinium darrowii]